MVILFPSYPSRPTQPDPAFGHEANAARKAGFQVAFVDLELQLGGDVLLRRLPANESQFIYRGWLLRPDDYEKLDNELRGQGLRLVTKADAYREAYEFPRWYEKAKTITPRSLVIPTPEGGFDLDAVAAQVEASFWTRLTEAQQALSREVNEWLMASWAKNGPHWFSGGQEYYDTLELPGPRPVVLKDFVKSRKGEWFEACFIPDARDAENVKRVTANFLRLTEGTLAGGLVFRQYETLKQIGLHAKTKMPVVNEWRAFMVDGLVIYLAPYWKDGDYSWASPPPVDMLHAMHMQARFASPFYTLDVAQREDGEWIIIEINDGGASGVPDGGDVKAFYAALAAALPG